MDKIIVYSLVILVFLFIVGRNRILPFIEKMKKKKRGNAQEGEASASTAPKICLSMDSSHIHDTVTYFDMCMVSGDDSLLGDSYLNDLQSRIEYAVNTRLMDFSKRGVCPDVRIAPVVGGVAVYFTYQR